MTATDSFAAACGQLRPLRLAVEHADHGRIADGELAQPFALIGSGAGCEITLNHPDIAERLACLQVFDGEAFVVSLDGSAVHRLTPESPLVVGPFALRLFESPADCENPILDPVRDPIADRMVPRVRLARRDATAAPLEIDRRLTFLGARSDPVAYLALTRDGLFVVDLLTPAGTRVNGEPVRTARLTDGDVLAIGAERYDVRIGGPDAEFEEQLVPLLPTAPPRLGTASDLDPDLAALVQQVGGLQSQLLDQFRRTVEGMIADFDNLRREQLVALRDEMARMSEVTGQMTRLREQTGVTELRPQPVEARALTVAEVEASEETAAVHMAVYERLSRLETERPGLWKRLRGLLGR